MTADDTAKPPLPRQGGSWRIEDGRLVPAVAAATGAEAGEKPAPRRNETRRKETGK